MSHQSLWALMTRSIKHQQIQYFRRKSNIPQRRYCDVNMPNLEAVSHSAFDCMEVDVHNSAARSGSILQQLVKFQQRAAELLMI